MSRRGPWRSERKRRWLAGLPCVICQSPYTQAAHVQNNGMSSKGSDEHTVPLCCTGAAHHDQFDGRRKLPNGQVGKRAFEVFYRVDMRAKAGEFHQRWLVETGQEVLA